MAMDGAPHLLTPVIATQGAAIHLAHARSPRSPGATTLCHELAAGPASAQHYHRLGCFRCAQEAVGLGVFSVHDLHNATVNLPRFLAAHKPAV